MQDETIRTLAAAIRRENSFMIEHPEEGEICEVLKHVSILSRDEIEIIKSKCLKEEFDYRKYVKQLEMFMKDL